jgi:hypothetical protein
MRENDRIDIWLLIVVPVVLFWALLCSSHTAPSSGGVGDSPSVLGSQDL